MNKLILKYKEVLAILCSNYKLPVSLPCCHPSHCHVCTPTCHVMLLSCQCPSCCYNCTPTCHAMGCCCPLCCCHPATHCAAMSTLLPVMSPSRVVLLSCCHLSCCYIRAATCHVMLLLHHHPSCCHNHAPSCHAMGCCCPLCRCHATTHHTATTVLLPVVQWHTALPIIRWHAAACCMSCGGVLPPVVLVSAHHCGVESISNGLWGLQTEPEVSLYLCSLFSLGLTPKKVTLIACVISSSLIAELALNTSRK